MSTDFLRKIPGTLTKQTQVYDLLKQALIEARFEPGQLVSIRELATSFGTSTMPVREAAARLITERALEALPNRGLRVPMLTQAEALDILSVRTVLEGTAAGLAAKEITAAEIKELEHHEVALEAAVRRKRLPEAVQVNLKFHLGVCRASRSQTLVSLIEALYLRAAPRVHRNIRLIPGDPDTQVEYVRAGHGPILDALRRRDSRAARQAMEADINAAVSLEAESDPGEEHVPPTKKSGLRHLLARGKRVVGQRR